MATQTFAAVPIPLRRPTALALFLTAGLVLCVAYLFVPSADAREGIYHVLGIAPSIALVLRARRHRPASATALYALAAGSACGALGDFLYFGYGWFGATTPFPGPADYMYIVGVLLIVAGLGAISLRSIGGRPRNMIDPAIVSLAAVLLIFTIVIGPQLDRHSSAWSAGVAALVPFCDSLLIVALMPLILGRPRNAALRFLAAYAVFNVLGDTVYALQSLHGTYVFGDSLDLSWLLGFVSLGAAALSSSLWTLAEPRPRRRFDEWGRLVALGSSTLIVFGVLATRAPRWDDDYLVISLGSALLISLIFIRTTLLNIERRATEGRLTLDARRLATIEAVQRDLSEGRELSEFLQSVCDRLHELVDCSVTISVRVGGELIVRASNGVEDFVVGQLLSRQSLAACAIAQDAVLISGNPAEDPRVDRCVAAHTGARALIAAPLHFGGEAVGVITVMSTRENALAPRDVRTTSLMASLISVAVGRDSEVAASRALEEQFQQAQKMAAVGRLTSGIAHDFNNMLTAIQGYGSFLLDLDDPTQRQYAEHVVEAAKRSAELTQQLLAYSRKRVNQPKVVDPNHVVDEIERMLRRLLGEDVELECALAPDVDDVLIDSGRLAQVLMNLAVNARDAMPRGGRLTISTAPAELTGLEGSAAGGAPAGRYARIAVTDTGVGMDDSTVEHIFEPFFTTKGEKGTGLGLATVYETVRQSGGYVGIRTAPGVGTSFSVYLPVCESSERIVTAA
ncbi:MAG TPA: ATP-binding protein [Gaiellaceae bacterium]|nr:ATP-binding protein [Gaiellaceae bacterium]